jgi:hypothetical protein
MNGDLIDIIEILIHEEYAWRYSCTFLGLNRKCTGCSCNECLLNTSPLYLTDYPNLLIQVKEITDE